MSTPEDNASQGPNTITHHSTSHSTHLTFPSWADEDLAKYETGSLRSDDQQSIRIDRVNTSIERKHIKAAKKRVKCEVRKYEQTRGGLVSWATLS